MGGGGGGANLLTKEVGCVGGGVARGVTRGSLAEKERGVRKAVGGGESVAIGAGSSVAVDRAAGEGHGARVIGG